MGNGIGRGGRGKIGVVESGSSGGGVTITNVAWR